MWTGLSQFTNALKEQAESVVRESGLDGQLEQARKAAAGLLLDVPKPEEAADPDEYQGSPHAPVSHFAGYAFPTTSGSDPEAELHDRDRESVAWHGLDSGGFSDVPLGSPPQRTSQTLPQSNGVKPRLQQVAHSLSHLGGTSSTGSETGPRQHELQAENASLQERLRAVENEAVEVLGELEELKDRLEASEAARAAAERRAEEGAARCSGLEAKAERCQDLAQAREGEARASAEAACLARNQLEAAQESFQKCLAESEAARERLARQLEDSQQLSLPSPVKHVAAEDEAADGAAAPAEDVKDLKAKLAKIKRQAITFKSKFTEAAAARDAALAELEALKQVHGGADPAVSGVENSNAVNKEMEQMQERLTEAESQCQALGEQLRESQEACTSLASEKAELAAQISQLSAQLKEQQAQMAAEALNAQQRDSELEAQLQKLEEAHSAAQERAGGIEARAAQLAGDLQWLQEEREALEASLRQQRAAADASEAALQATEAYHSRQLEDATGRLEAAVAELERVKEERAAPQSELGRAQEALASTAAPAEITLQNGDDRHAAAEGNGSMADTGAMQSNPLFSPAKGGNSTAMEGAEEPPGKNKPARGKAAAAKRIAELQEALREKSQDLDRMTNELASAQAALAERSAEAERLAAELVAASEKLQAASASSKDGLAELQVQLAAARGEASSREASAAGAAEEIAALKAAAASAVAERDGLVAELASVQQEAKEAAEEAARHLPAANGDSAASAAAGHQEEVEGLQASLEAGEARAAHLMERFDEQQKLLEASQTELQEALSEARTQAAAEGTAAAAAREEAKTVGCELHLVQEEVTRLQGALQQAQAAEADAAVSSNELKSRISAAEEVTSRLQEDVRRKEEELKAVRGGASVESNLAASAIKQGNQRAEEAEQAAAQADERASQAEQHLTTAAARAQAELMAADSRRREAESQRDRLQEQLDQAQAEAQVLREALEAERSAAAADAASMQHRLEQEGASACSRARNEAASEWQKRLQEHAQQSDAVLAEKSAALERAEADVERLEKALNEAGTAAQALSDTRALTEGLERDLGETRKQLVEATGQLDTVRQEAAEAQSAAIERQKKFSMLNATFRKKEEGLLARVEEAESAASQLRAEAAAAQHLATLAQQEAQRLETQAGEQAARLAAAEAACAAAERGREDAQRMAAETAAQLVAAQTQLASAQAARSEAAADAASFEDRVHAAVSVREEDAAQRVREAEEAQVAAEAQVKQAEARAAAAEAAKIELSLKLADALSQEESADDVSAVPTPITPRQTGTSEEWAERYEELELAARVASRRAAAAEAELHRLKQQLDAADKRAKELAWQIKMISDPRQIGGQQAAGGAPAGVASSVMDIFGCGANYRR